MSKAEAVCILLHIDERSGYWHLINAKFEKLQKRYTRNIKLKQKREFKH